MTKSAFAICLVATLLYGAGARDLLGQPDGNSCATYTYGAPKDINQCPCSGTSKDKKHKFKGTWKMKNFWMDKDNKMWCDGHVTGSWGNKPGQSCDKHPISFPVTVEPCGTKSFPPPPGKCSDWCSPKPRNNPPPYCGDLVMLPEICGCSADELVNGPPPVARRALLGGGQKKHACGSDNCPVVSMFLGPVVDADLGDVVIEMDQVELMIGGNDSGFHDEMICLIGNQCNIGNPTHLPTLLNTWMGGCRNPNKCSILSDVGVTVSDIGSALGSILG